MTCALCTSVSAFSLAGAAGCSSMSAAAADTISGNTAVSANTPRGPQASTSAPLKYALATPPSAADAQHNDCSEPAVACKRHVF